jgi:hypothetical protein
LSQVGYNALEKMPTIKASNIKVDTWIEIRRQRIHQKNIYAIITLEDMSIIEIVS